MSLKRSYIRFAHKVDLYTKITTKNDMGQNKAAWNLSVNGQVCSYVPSGSSTAIRITPSVEEADYFTVYFPHDADVNYSTRFKDLRVIVGEEVIESKWMQVIQIDKHISFTGQLQHLQVKLKSVIEP